MSFFVFGLCLTLILSFALYNRPCFAAAGKSGGNFFFCKEDDVKIAPDFSTKKLLQNPLEPSNEEIERYYRHRNCKNLDRARKLGCDLAQNILSLQDHCEENHITPALFPHAMMLYLFVSEHCLLQSVTDPILHKLVLSQMNDTISLSLPDFYSNVCQYRSYTLYKLCLEEEEQQTCEHRIQSIGKCWAHIAGDENNEELCALGQTLYLQMSRRCAEILDSVTFLPV